jgi:hypothetical protein
MLYRPNASRASRPRLVSGVSLAQYRRRMSVPERAVLGAEILRGDVKLVCLTARSIAALVGVSVASLGAAWRATPEQRQQIKNGKRPLVPSHPRTSPVPAAVDWAAVDDVVLADIVRAVGINRTLDAAAAAENSIN